MIYIIEGPNGSGKTSLLNSIRADRRKPCLFLDHSGDFEAYERIQAEVDWMNQAPSDLTIFCDRHRIISGSIEAGILRNTSFIPADYKLKPKPLGQPDTAFVYCRPPDETIHANLKQSPPLNAAVTDNIDRLIQAYDSLFKAISRKSLVLRFDYTRTRTKTFIDEIFDLKRHLNG